MSGHQPSAPQKGKSSQGRGGRQYSIGLSRLQVYLPALTDQQAELLTDRATTRPLKDAKKISRADVAFDQNPSPVPGMKDLNIRGAPSQIRAAVSLVSQKTGSKETLSEQAQTFWLQWVEAAFPDLDSRAYFLPPVYINRVPMTRQSTAGQDLLFLQSGQTGQSGQSSQSCQSEKIPSSAASIPQPPRVQDSDLRDDAAMQRMLLCLQKLCEDNKEVMFGLTQIQFGQFLGEPCYTAAAAQLALPANLPSALPRNWKQGDFDVLLIHRHFGLIICEVKAFGDNTQALNMSKDNKDKIIRKKLKEAVSQLNKAEAMLSHLVSDIAIGLPVTKNIAFPNLTSDEVQQAISCDTQLSQDLCQCLGTRDTADIAGVCLCSDQLSDPKTPWDVSSHVLRKLRHWWQRRVAGAGPDSHMTREVYKRLVARFCGPATTVTVPCTSPPRVSVKTLGQVVWGTGECYTAVITLFPEQIHLFNTAPPRLFVTGPPGTGKTVVLLLMGIKWLRFGHHVYIVSTWYGSRAACIMLYHLLLRTVNTQQSACVSPGQPHLLLYDLYEGKDVTKAVNDLSQAASGGSLYVIADEEERNEFQTLCEKLLTRVPRLHLWAASCYHGDTPAGWQVEYLTRPLRSPPAVVREVEQHDDINKYGLVLPYSERGMPDHTDGPSVTRLYHRGQGHSGNDGLLDCVTCGREVASILHSLRVGVTENHATTSTTFSSTRGGATPPYLQWRDVLVLLDFGDVSDDAGMVKALKEADIPGRVMKDDDIEDVALARSDVVWVANGYRIRGLERKVVVCLVSADYDTIRLHFMSRCTSHLVIVYGYMTSRNTFVERTPTQGKVFQRSRKWFTGGMFMRMLGVESDEHSTDDSEVDKKEATEENRKGERKKLEACSQNEVSDTEMQSKISLAADSKCCSIPYKITVDLRKAISLKTLQRVREPNRLHDECDQGKATEKSEDITPSPIFSYHWQNISRFSAEGGRLRGEGSDVVLTVPFGAVEVNTNVTVHASVCVNDVYIKHKLQLAATETIVSPLAEFWAGPDFRFKKHVKITLPTCLPSDYDVDLLHVYCITSGGQEEEINISKIQRLDDVTQTPDKETLEACFKVNEERQVEVMTLHFSGYVCTYCGLCQNMGLEVYASHKYDNESVQVSVIAQLWDKLHISDFRQWKPELNSFTVVLSTTFQLKKILKPAELQVDLIIDDEQKTTWEFKKMPAPANTFCLNWGKVACDNSKDHLAVKYTDLGPFSPGWKLKSKASENGVMPSTLDAYIRVSHLQTQDSIEPLWSSAPCQCDVQSRNGKDKYVSNGSNGNCPVININNVHGDVTFAQQLLTQTTENVLYLTENNQSTSQTMLKRLEQPDKDTTD